MLWLQAAVYFWTLWHASLYGVDPAFALAVAHIESRQGAREFRTGLLAGQWYGPFNIHRDFAQKWPEIMAIKGNCRRGVMALRGSSPRRILQRYNAEFNEAYYQAVLAAARKYRLRLKRKTHGHSFIKEKHSCKYRENMPGSQTYPT